jgi:dihydrofolate reductase
MRRVRFSAAVSLDGYIAGPKGESDWIVMDPEIDFGALMSAFDTILLGRKTYEATRQHGGGLPLLPDLAKQTRLTLKNHQVYSKTGTVSLEYALA